MDGGAMTWPRQDPSKDESVKIAGPVSASPDDDDDDHHGRPLIVRDGQYNHIYSAHLISGEEISARRRQLTQIGYE